MFFHINTLYIIQLDGFNGNIFEFSMFRKKMDYENEKNIFKIRIELFEKYRLLKCIRDSFYIFPFRRNTFGHSKFLPFQKTLYKTTIESYSE
jgi:hypothetical protein